MKETTFLGLLNLKRRKIFALLGLFALVNGLWRASLLFLINYKITGASLPFVNENDWMVFVVLIIGSALMAYFFKAKMVRLTLNFGKDMVLQILNELRLSNYESYLKFGDAKVRTVLGDVGTLQSLPEVFTAFFNAIIMIVVGVIYLFWIYPKGALLVLGIIFLLSIIYVYRNKTIEGYMDESRELSDSFMSQLNDFLYGFKSIKMSSRRNNTIYYDHLTDNREKAVKLNTKSEIGVLVNDLLGEYFFYLVIGIILFVLPLLFEVNNQVIAGFLVTVLFLMGPITIFISLIKSFLSFRVSLRRVNEFKRMASKNRTYNDISDPSQKMTLLKNISVRNLRYKYLDKNGNAAFELKPVNMTIKKGEVIFITGGNGSGKSTFINLLSGLFAPFSGEIYFDELLVTDKNRAHYRDSISCIFSDNHIFSENYDGFDLLPSNSFLIGLLEQMNLSKLIPQNELDNKLSNELSSGQKKRLALIYSILEEKDIFIFDEWAAEQDPYFRKYFYTQIIPDLKSKGKTIVAITHDDMYYSCCDRIIKFEYGELVK